MEFHPKTATNFLAIRKDLYSSASTTAPNNQFLNCGNLRNRFPSLNTLAVDTILSDSTLHLVASQNQTDTLDSFPSDIAKFEDESVVDADCIDKSSTEKYFSSSLECSDCGKRFLTRSHLSKHIKSHSKCSPGTAWLYRCSYCQATFDQQEEFLRHEKTSHVSQKSTTTVAHSTTSTDKTVYECDFGGCLRHYTSYSSFMKHRKTHLTIGESSQVSSTVSVSSEGKQRHPSEKKFQCSQCSKRFPTSKDLKRHDVVHTGNREFQCSFCSHRFGRKDHRMRHEKKAHASELSPPQPQRTTLSRVVVSPTRPQEQLVVQRQPQWSRRHSSSVSPHGLKLDDVNPLSPTLDDDCDRKPMGLEKLFENASTDSAEPLEEITLTSDDGDEVGEAKTGFDWMISDLDGDLPKGDASGFYPPEIKAEPLVDVKDSEIIFGDYLTRTKNPVLPSVYVDNSQQSLLVSEPLKTRNLNTLPRAPLFEEDDFMADVDVFFREKDIFSNI